MEQQNNNQPNWVSKCCNSKLHPIASNETGYYICSKCNNPCDVAHPKFAIKQTEEKKLSAEGIIHVILTHGWNPNDMINTIKKYSDQQNVDIRKENDELQEWKNKQIEIWLPVIEFMQNRKDVSIGDSISKKVIELIEENDEWKLTCSQLKNSFQNADKAHFEMESKYMKLKQKADMLHEALKKIRYQSEDKYTRELAQQASNKYDQE